MEAEPCRAADGGWTNLCTMGKHDDPGSANLGRSAGGMMRNWLRK